MLKEDGSGNVLFQTRTHLRKIDPATRNTRTYNNPIRHNEHEKDIIADPHVPISITGTLVNGTQVIDPVDQVDPNNEQLTPVVVDNNPLNG